MRMKSESLILGCVNVYSMIDLYVESTFIN